MNTHDTHEIGIDERSRQLLQAWLDGEPKQWPATITASVDQLNALRVLAAAYDDDSDEQERELARYEGEALEARQRQLETGRRWADAARQLADALEAQRLG